MIDAIIMRKYDLKYIHCWGLIFATLKLQMLKFSLKSVFCNSSSDDLLNYELGDDIDDQALYGADEDELLLSDDGK